MRAIITSLVAALAIAAAPSATAAENYKPYQAKAAKVIRQVFGPRYAREAISVAWCESRLTVAAYNGQYLGLFQMGSNERKLFGHGNGAYAQARAAKRYFVRSGRNWSPWSCRWAA